MRNYWIVMVFSVLIVLSSSCKNPATPPSAAALGDTETPTPTQTWTPTVTSTPTPPCGLATCTSTATPVDYYIIDDLEDNDIYLNPNLVGGGNGFWCQYGYVATPIPTIFVVPNTLSGGLNTTAYALRMQASLTDPADGSYPEVFLRGWFRSIVTNRYDASQFSGIKYLVYVGAGDNAVKRKFHIRIADTTHIADSGTCFTNCYDHFGIAMPSVPTGGWVSQSVTFSTAVREGWGNPIIPTTLSGHHLQELLSLDWVESRNNVAGTSTIDFWVDQIEFIP